MSRPNTFIAGDWGTSNCRLTLVDASGLPGSTVKLPGAAAARGKHAELFDDATAGWRREHGDLPAVLCGMVGSTIGWFEASYLPCPAELGELSDSVVSPRVAVFIVPGMRCTNPLAAPDVMRGEETQLLGARRLHPALAQGRHLICMPGTHTKWVSLSDGVVQEFITAPAGELFALLCDHSVLVRDQATPVSHVPADFERGIAEAAKHPGALLHQVFQARSLRLDQQLSAEGAASWISGLLTGADVDGALKLFAGHEPAAPVYVIGAEQLVKNYSLVLQRRGRRPIPVSGDQASLAGLTQVFHERFPE